MNPLYQAFICCFVKFVLEMRKSMSSLGSFLLPAPPISSQQLASIRNADLFYTRLHTHRAVKSVLCATENPNFPGLNLTFAKIMGNDQSRFSRDLMGIPHIDRESDDRCLEFVPGKLKFIQFQSLSAKYL